MDTEWGKTEKGVARSSYQEEEVAGLAMQERSRKTPPAMDMPAGKRTHWI